jgi:HrpJ-like domain
MSELGKKNISPNLVNNLRIQSSAATAVNQISQMAQNASADVQKKYTPQQIKHFLHQTSQLRALRRRNFQMPENDNSKAPVLDEESCEDTFTRMNGLNQSSRFLQARSRRFLSMFAGYQDPERIKEQFDELWQQTLHEEGFSDQEPANQYMLCNYLIKQNQKSKEANKSIIQEKLEQELEKLYGEKGKEITAKVNTSLQAREYSANREKIRLFQDAYYQLLETISDVPSMMEYYFSRFSLEEFLQVSNLITQAAIAHQQSYIMPCLHRESIHALLAFMNQRTLLYSCIYSIRELLIKQKIIKEDDIPLDDPQTALKKLKALSEKNKQDQADQDQEDQEDQEDQGDENQQNQQDAKKTKADKTKGDQPKKIPIAERNLRDVLKMVLDLSHGKVLLEIDEHLQKINERLINYSTLKIREVSTAERLALQQLLKLVRDLAIPLWQEDSHRMKVLATIYELLGEYNQHMEYTPFNRDKFFV